MDGDFGAVSKNLLLDQMRPTVFIDQLVGAIFIEPKEVP